MYRSANPPARPKPRDPWAGADPWQWKFIPRNQKPPTTRKQPKQPKQPGGLSEDTYIGPQTANVTKQSSYDYHTDPLYQQQIAGLDQDLALSHSSALENQKRLLLGFGSRELAQRILGNDPFVSSISDDPANSLSTLAQITANYKTNVANRNEELNNQNLWYSGYRGSELSRLGRERLTSQAQAQAQVEEALAQISAQLLEAERNARGQRGQYESEAYQRGVDSGAYAPITEQVKIGGRLPKQQPFIPVGYTPPAPNRTNWGLYPGL